MPDTAGITAVQYAALKSGFTSNTVVLQAEVVIKATASCFGVETFHHLPAPDRHQLVFVGAKSGCQTSLTICALLW